LTRFVTTKREKQKRRKLNMIGENPSQPCALNEPERLARLLKRKRERDAAESRKAERKKQKAEKKNAREEAKNEQAKEKRTNLEKEEPIIRLLFELGLQKQRDKKPTVKAMKAFMKANRISCKSAHPSRAALVSHLLERLALHPPDGGWRVSQEERKNHESDDEEKSAECEDEEDESDDQPKDAEEDEGDQHSTDVTASNLPSSHHSRSGRLVKQRSFAGQARSDLMEL
jgi:hypothetical protein